MILHMFIFFFSSRRRHTRLVSDWSSDVCSSDLAVAARQNVVVTAFKYGRTGRSISSCSTGNPRTPDIAHIGAASACTTPVHAVLKASRHGEARLLFLAAGLGSPPGPSDRWQHSSSFPRRTLTEAVRPRNLMV